MLSQNPVQDSNDKKSQTISRRDFIRGFTASLASAAILGVNAQQKFAATGTTLATWDASTFAAHLGKSFTVNLGSAGSVTLTLSQVKDGISKISHGPKKMMTTAPAGQNFVLVFRGPAKPGLTQKTYTFQHAQLGKFSLFLVPGSADATGRNYIAIVNHIHV